MPHAVPTCTLSAPGRRYAVSTDSAAPASGCVRSASSEPKGEVMLFTGAPSGQHGTPDIIRIIAEQGPDERVSAMSGMFGAGVYFAERCSKADAYAGPGQPEIAPSSLWRASPSAHRM